MKTFLITLLVALTLTPALHAAEGKKKAKQAEKRTPFTKLIKLTDFDTKGNWMEEDGGVLHLRRNPHQGKPRRSWLRVDRLRLSTFPS